MCDQKSLNAHARALRRASVRYGSLSAYEDRYDSSIAATLETCIASPFRNAPPPADAHQRFVSAGADTTPTVMRPFSSVARALAPEAVAQHPLHRLVGLGDRRVVALGAHAERGRAEGLHRDLVRRIGQLESELKVAIHARGRVA